jgi:cytochrome c553
MIIRYCAARWMRSIHRAVVLSSILVTAGAAYAQTPPPKGDAALGATKAAMCLSCHGPAPGAPLAGMPSLAGQQEEFLVLQMILLREGLRDVPLMAGTLKSLSDRDLIDIAAYFGSRKPLLANSTRDAQRHAQGAALSQKMGCGSCHMNDYRGQRQVPRLVNQREDYLAATLKAYRDNKRSGTDTSMNAVMYQVTDGDIQALAHYLASQ